MERMKSANSEYIISQCNNPKKIFTIVTNEAIEESVARIQKFKASKNKNSVDPKYMQHFKNDHDMFKEIEEILAKNIADRSSIENEIVRVMF
jgi:hypothetical protein